MAEPALVGVALSRRRIYRAYFRVMRRLFSNPGPRRYAELKALASRLANRLAGLDRLRLFSQVSQ